MRRGRQPDQAVAASVLDRVAGNVANHLGDPIRVPLHRSRGDARRLVTTVSRLPKRVEQRLGERSDVKAPALRRTCSSLLANTSRSSTSRLILTISMPIIVEACSTSCVEAGC